MVEFNLMRFKGFVFGAALVSSMSLSGASAKSAEIDVAYSKIDEASCMTLIVNEEEGWSQQVCKGVEGIAVFVSEGDLRMSISYRKQNAGDRYFTFGNFNSIGKVMEWRLSERDGYKQPFATILRWHVSLQEGGQPDQALVISKIEDDDFCIAGFVEATVQKDANVLARQVADNVAPTFRCGEDKPQWHGKKGPLSKAMVSGL